MQVINNTSEREEIFNYNRQEIGGKTESEIIFADWSALVPEGPLANSNPGVNFPLSSEGAALFS